MNRNRFLMRRYSGQTNRNLDQRKQYGEKNGLCKTKTFHHEKNTFWVYMSHISTK